MSTPPRALITALTAAAAAAVFAAGADAAPRRGAYRYVTAESHYGTATITGPVRFGPQGRLEVGLPGGTWMECGRSCSDTLRRETIDFWQAHDPRGADGPGYLRRSW